MNDRTGWNIKGIHARARDAAREAARQEGLTLGEYLTRLLTEDGGSLRGARQSRDDRQANEIPRPAGRQSDPYAEDEDPLEALERLTNRIEAVEARSTLAISGIDQSVVGLLKRLEQADQANSELSSHVDGLMEDISETHDSLKRAIERVEADDSSRRALEGMRAIETALGKLADHVYAEGEATQNDTDAIKGRVEAGFADLNDRVEGMEATVNARLREAGERFDRAVEAAEQRSQGAASHLAEQFRTLEKSVLQRIETAEAAMGENGALNQRIEALESGMSDAIGTLEETLRRLQGRLETAEAGTNSALSRLQDTLGTLDTRIQSVAEQAVQAGGRQLKVEFEARFEGLAEDLRASIERTRSELAGQIEAAATAADPAIFTALRGDIDGLRVTLETTEQRHAEALSVLSDRLDTTVSDVNRRARTIHGDMEALRAEIGEASGQLAETRTRIEAMDGRIGELAGDGDGERADAVAERLDQFAANVEQRLSYVETGVSGMGEANVLAVQDEVAQLSSAVSTRLDGLEARETETVHRLGEQMTRLTDTIDERIEASERNSASAIEQLGQTVASITRRMEARHNQALSAMDEKLAAAQRQQDERLSEALSQVSVRLNEMQSVSRENVSPIQRAIASLAARLDALESFNAPPFTDKAVEQDAFGEGGPPPRPFVGAPVADQRPADTWQAEADDAGPEELALEALTTDSGPAPAAAIDASPSATGPDDAADWDLEDDESEGDDWQAEPAQDAPADPIEATGEATENLGEPDFAAPGAPEPSAEETDALADTDAGAAPEPLAETQGAGDTSGEAGTGSADASVDAQRAASAAMTLTGGPWRQLLRERLGVGEAPAADAPESRDDIAASGAAPQSADAGAGELAGDAGEDLFGEYGDVPPPYPAETRDHAGDDSRLDASAPAETASGAEGEAAAPALEPVANSAPGDPAYAAELAQWQDLMEGAGEDDRDFDAEPLSPDVTVGAYAEDFEGGEVPHTSASDEDYDPIAELENWSDASEGADITGDGDGELPEPVAAAEDDENEAARSDPDAALFDATEPPAAPRDIPRPSLAEQQRADQKMDGPDLALEDDTGNYLRRARAAAIAAAEEASAKSTRKHSLTGSRATVIAAATMVGLATAGTAGYLYLRGKQSPAPSAFPANSAGDTARETAALPPAQEAADAMAALLEPDAGVASGATDAPGGETDVEDLLFDAEPAAEGLPASNMPSAAPEPEPALASDEDAASSLTPAGLPLDTGQAGTLYPPIPAGRDIRAAVTAGDPVAELLHGQDLIANGTYAEGVRLISAAARDGLAAAQYQLAKLHEKGLGVPRDITAARTWTERAAAGNNIKAMHDLAVFYAEGEGGEQSYSRAAEWFGRAADHGVIDSQYNLAVLYERGLGVTKNLDEAAFWFAAAEREGDSGAGARLATLREKMTAEAHQAAIARAERWKPSEMDARANGDFERKSWGFGAPNQVRAVQNAFIVLGFSDVSATGEVDAATARAIRAFEAEHGLDVTGRVTPELVRKLNEGASSAS